MNFRNWIEMRKIFLIAIASAMVLCMMQCKKEKEIIPYNNKAFNITLDVSDGAKTNVDPTTGVVTFVDGDEIIVANSGKYVGTLTYEDGVFSGTVTGANENDYLHFYHLGNRDVGVLTEGTSTGCHVSIADQTVDLPVISYAPSTVKFSSGVTSYTARLQNKCALVKFDVTNASAYAGMCITGMRNRVDVSFSTASFVFSTENDGKITLASGSGERWAVLLPQPLAAAGEVGSAFSGAYKGVRDAVPEINADDYLPDGITVTATTKYVPEGALASLFSISEGKQVNFAKGNLLYYKNTGTWELRENQYQREYDKNSIVGTDNSSRSRVEHFGWGTSGFNHGAVYYEPWRTLSGSSYYYVYGDADKNLNDETGTADWGYNRIENGGGAYKQWRVMTAEELHYLLYERDGASEKYSYATITVETKNITGMVLLPDAWTEPYPDCFTPGITNNFEQNYSISEWLQMEESGALFLPCSGRRNVTSSVAVGFGGFYWTSTAYDADNAISAVISQTGLEDNRLHPRYDGTTIRLIIE